MTLDPRSPLGRHRAAVAAYLRGITPVLGSVAGEIIQERAAVQPDPDLLRPGLVLWACAACGGDERAALPVAAAFELFDRFVLLHDELVENPSGTVARWGLGQSLNAGDALYALALRALALDAVDPLRRLRAAKIVAHAVLQSIEGRNIDVGRSERGERNGFLARVRSLRRRSAALTGAALQAGAVLADAPPDVARAFDRAGRLLAAAATVRDAALSERIVRKAVAAIERCGIDAARAGAFAAVARGAIVRVA
jgi:hypothetical protein